MSNTTINIGGKMFTYIDSSKLVDKKEEKQIGFSLEKCMEILSQTQITRTDLNITQEELEEEEQDIYLNCFFCEVEIIRDSEEHDICHITREGDLCCEDCLSCCDCENCEKEKRFNEFKLLWDNLDGDKILSKEIIQKLKSLDIEEAYQLFK